MPKDAKKDNKAGRSKLKGGVLLAQMTIALSSLMVVGVAALAVWGYTRMEAKVASTITDAAPLRIVIEWPPLAQPKTKKPADAAAPVVTTWVDVATQEDLATLAERMITADPFDRACLKNAATALEGTGWFKRIESIRREPGGVVRIKGAWRIPGAVVRHQGIDHLVSTEGERLPVDYKEGRSGLRFVMNPAFPPPEPGEKWVGGDVQAGLSLLAQLRESPALSQVAGVDAANYVKAKRLVIVSDKGNRVVWGSAPSDFNPNEPDCATKLRFLSVLMSSPDFGHRIDANKAIIFLTSKSGIIYDSTAQPAGEVSPLDGAPGEDEGGDNLVSGTQERAEIVRTRQE